jgi:hypothetical protein
MAKQKKIYRTIITLTVLSDYPLPEGMSLEEIDGECSDGEMTGKTDWLECNKELQGEAAANAMRDVGSATEFFQMDENGNELNDNNEE